MAIKACLKTVASAILADLESGFQPDGKDVERTNGPVCLSGSARRVIFPGGKMPSSTAGQEARRYF
jgi:hypothetical protein